MQQVAGIIQPSFDVIAVYHPQFALAVLAGIQVRPNLRTVQCVFSNFALNQPVEESFDQQITGYSIFSGFDYTLDPTNAFAGNILKGLSDTTQAMVSGITCELMVRSRDEHDYLPIPVQTPLQMMPSVLSRAAGIWAMNSPDNIKQRFTLISTPPGDGPLTVWCVYSFLVLGEGAQQFLCMSTDRARDELRKRGYGPGALCSPGGGPGGQAAV